MIELKITGATAEELKNDLLELAGIFDATPQSGDEPAPKAEPKTRKRRANVTAAVDDPKPEVAEAKPEDAKAKPEPEAAKAKPEPEAKPEAPEAKLEPETPAVLDYNKDVRPVLVKLANHESNGRERAIAILSKYGVKNGADLPADKLNTVLTEAYSSLASAEADAHQRQSVEFEV